MFKRFLFWCLLSLAFCPPNAFCQWVTQTIELRAGWTAVFLTVEPYPAECGLQLEGLPIESVWYCDQNRTAVQFIQNPDELLPETPEWRVFYPASRPEAFATNLKSFQAGACYLIKSSEAATWTIKGRAKLTVQQWKPDAYNLVGFHVDGNSPCTFSTWFAPSAAHTPLDVWELGADDRWHQVIAPPTETIKSGKAYWVYCNSSSFYQGPVEIDMDGDEILTYTRLTSEKNFQIEHKGSGARNVIVKPLASETVPAQRPDTPDVELLPCTGDVPLAYLGLGLVSGDGQYKYHALPVTVAFESTEKAGKILQLAVQRRKMANNGDGYYQSLLEITDGRGFRRLVGVLSEGRQGSPTAGLLRKSGSLKAFSDPPEEVGLWAGTVTLNKAIDANGYFAETPAEFNFRAIIHVDDQGKARLLNEVTELLRKATTKLDPDTGLYVEDQPGRYLLMTRTAPQTLLNEIGTKVVPGTIRDGRLFANRISSAMFSLNDANGAPEDPVMTVSGDFFTGGSTATATIVLEDHDPLNPFHHQYHPQHAYVDNPSALNRFDVTRQVTFTFDDRNDETVPGANEPGWGDNVVGGVYEEVLTGIKKVDQGSPPVRVGGRFTLTRVSMVSVLNDGM